jgi:hypothetical protein
VSRRTSGSGASPGASSEPCRPGGRIAVPSSNQLTATQVYIAAIGQINTHDVHDRSSGLPEPSRQPSDRGQHRRGAGNLKRLAIQHISLRVDRNQRAGVELRGGVGIDRHVATV